MCFSIIQSSYGVGRMDPLFQQDGLSAPYRSLPSWKNGTVLINDYYGRIILVSPSVSGTTTSPMITISSDRVWKATS